MNKSCILNQLLCSIVKQIHVYIYTWDEAANTYDINAKAAAMESALKVLLEIKGKASVSSTWTENFGGGGGPYLKHLHLQWQ